MVKNKNLIIFRIIFNQKTGSGHLYQALGMIEELELKNYKIIFILNSYDGSLNKKIANEIEVLIEKDLVSQIKDIRLENYNKVYFINDTLDSSMEEIKIIKNLGFKVACIEDRGEGAELSDLLINSLYKKTTQNINELNGPKYNIFRNEFYKERLQLIDKNDENKILVSFGGTDPSKSTERVVDMLLSLNIRNFAVLNPPHRNIKDSKYLNWIIKGEVNVAKEINESRFVISSGGRTVYEANFLKTNSLVICQNERELSHYCLSLKSVINLGIYSDLTLSNFTNGITNITETQNKLFVEDWLSKKEILNLILK